MRIDASEENLMSDEYARLFSLHVAENEGAGQREGARGEAPLDWASRSFDMLATKFVDESVLNIASMVNMNREQEYSQVVLIGDGTCTRFCRLPWAQGTVIFLVAPSEVHERADAILKAQDEKIVAPRGCMLRRVDCDLSEPSGLLAALEAKGFRGSKLSVFGLQGLRAMDLSHGAFDRLFAEISDAAAFESVVVGEIMADSAVDMEGFVAGYGMQGSDVPLGMVVDRCVPTAGDADPRWMSAVREAGQGERERERERERGGWRLFRATQRRLSLEEMETLALHSAAAEEIGEDFFGNFS